MELSKYVGKYVKVEIINSPIYFEGYVNSSDDDSINIKDKMSKDVDIKEESIAFIREVGR